MNLSHDKKQLIFDVIKKSEHYIENKILIDFVIKDVYSKSSFIFDITDDENEIFNYINSILEASFIKFFKTKRGKTKIKMPDKYKFNVVDPINISFDMTKNKEYLKNLLTKLYEAELKFPNKQYASIFYEKYIHGLDSIENAKIHNISKRELELRLLDIVKFINKKD